MQATLKPEWPVVVYTGERPHQMTSLWNAENYWLTRTVFQRGLGLIYLIAFLNAVNEFKPLLGGHGLLPVREWIQQATSLPVLVKGISHPDDARKAIDLLHLWIVGF